VDAAFLAPLINGYSVARDPYSVTIPSASQLRDLCLKELTVDGALLNKQLTHIDINSQARTWRYPANSNTYDHMEADGDIHFALGTETLHPHVPCEIQNGTQNLLDTLNNSIGQPISVTGFFRCLFEHPGYWGNTDAHIFEIHPVGNMAINGQNFSFDVGKPDPQATRPWSSRIADQDGKVEVQYDSVNDILNFTSTGRMDTNYVQVGGKISNIQLDSNEDGISTFSFDSQEIGYIMKGLCLRNTNAYTQLGQINDGAVVNLLGLRNIDLDSAINNQQYVINLLAVDIS
jgi:hypothetical protein